MRQVLLLLPFLPTNFTLYEPIAAESEPSYRTTLTGAVLVEVVVRPDTSSGARTQVLGLACGDRFHPAPHSGVIVACERWNGHVG